MSMKRFKVAGHSMTPALEPGEEVIATTTGTPRPGDLVVFEHPRKRGLWLIKRLVDETGYVLSDNPEVGDNDSRTIGVVPVEDMHTVVERLDAGTFLEACALLAREDESLARAVDTHGLPDFWHRRPGLPTLVWLILEQQVSLESGAAMYRRLDEAAGGVTPASISGLGEAGMRAIGITRQKAEYLARLAELTLSGEVDIEGLADQRWDTARSLLVSLKGIGPWTADAYLLSALRLPDMWPVGDRALQVGTGEVLGMGTTPDEEELEIIANPWRPARAVAARIIWHAYLTVRGRIEPAEPMS